MSEVFHDSGYSVRSTIRSCWSMCRFSWLELKLNYQVQIIPGLKSFDVLNHRPSRLALLIIAGVAYNDASIARVAYYNGASIVY